MNWFNRKQKNINTPTAQKKELPDGMWYKTPEEIYIAGGLILVGCLLAGSNHITFQLMQYQHYFRT